MNDARYCDRQAAAFDDQADHRLRDPRVRDAWRRLLVAHLPAAPAAIADIGCGTGTLSVLLTAEGYAVTALDDPVLWGGPVDDERYLLVSRR
jgi:2-polyprenyl-3-methyl-5-hydroxy-6-metoxy-1,4-benzoquinol methylase